MQAFSNAFKYDPLLFSIQNYDRTLAYWQS